MISETVSYYLVCDICHERIAEPAAEHLDEALRIGRWEGWYSTVGTWDQPDLDGITICGETDEPHRAAAAINVHRFLPDDRKALIDHYELEIPS